MKTKVSVIVPVFGVEKFIERCVRSLFSQTMDNEDVEFIFVNDCTQDSSMEILARVMAEFPEKNVTILNHVHNLGLPAARQTGVKAATGDYVIHCDSDDWVEPEYCSKMYEAAIAHDADIVVCRYCLNDGEKAFDEVGYRDNLLSDSSLAVGAAILLKSSPYAWNKLVRRSLYDNAAIQYPKRFLAEDWALMVQLIMSAGKIVVVEDKLYNYFVNPSSICREQTKEICLKKIADEEENVRLVDDLLKQRHLSAKYKTEMTKRKAITKSMVFPCTGDSECRRVWRRTFRDVNWTIPFNPELDWVYRRKHLLLLLGLYAPMRWLYHILLPKS